jgi:glycosyltransferase involved in cell wall biosynthesis
VSVPSGTAQPLPDVDVVIATRDRPELLATALEAVWHQTYAGAIHCTVVFDQSATRPELARSDAVAGAGHRDVTVVGNDRTPGLAGARNSGILAGHGELVAFCDDDDEWLPTKIATQVEALSRSSALTSVTGIIVCYADREVTRVPTAADVELRRLVRSRSMAAHPSTVLVRRAALAGPIGLVDEQIPGSYGEDFDWLIRAAQSGGIAVVAEPLVRVLWGQSMFSQRWQTIIDSIDYSLDKHRVFHEDPAALGRLYGRRAFALAALGRTGAALRQAANTVRVSPRERRAYLAVAVALRLVSAERLMAIAHRRGHGI